MIGETKTKKITDKESCIKKKNCNQKKLLG